ncbi:hypothetical protein PSHI8_03020 [Polynucleobacter sp. SHI8]|uniref:hypothetical protein n=1 Tax=unclassified Polynucleobacter TaxID=2640945 RepID=UPI00249278E7|nr:MULTISPECIES: hypothetical protein [unclassified Polynucleobacter]BDW10220.1 hypothetical protein PSHI2_03020 [Polynucleobacter sp. SHI2]BDW12666.1 hypothetical protein PSHI8_03020 [Polynucleobacter sp. SHI8]
MSYQGYSFEPGRYETRALEKYLGITEQVVDLEALVTLASSSTNEPIIIIASDLPRYQTIFDTAKRKIILIHLSDEAYDVKRCRLYQHPQISLIVRNNEVFPFSFLLIHSFKWLYWFIKWALVYWVKEQSISKNLDMVRHTFLSRRYLLRQMRMALLIRKVSAKVIGFPLNETNFYLDGETEEVIAKSIPVSFAGTTHSAERIMASKTAQQLGYSHGYSGSWGPGGQGSLSSKDYVKLLKSSEFALCPNGHVNQDCFRFYEIICAGSLPLVPASTPYQPFGYYQAIYDLDPRLAVNTFRVDDVKKQMDAIPPADRVQILKRLQKSIASKNEYAKRSISNCFHLHE